MFQLGSTPGKGFWARHRWKMLLSLGVAGAGYAAYRFYDAHQKQLVRVEQRAEEERAADEIIKNQLQAHFEKVQRISDTTTLPFAMHYLRSRIMEELDISHLTERLLQGKGELTPEEKYETWEKIKILSFTRTVSSMWAMTLLSLYVRVQIDVRICLSDLDDTLYPAASGIGLDVMKNIQEYMVEKLGIDKSVSHDWGL